MWDLGRECCIGDDALELTIIAIALKEKGLRIRGGDFNRNSPVCLLLELDKIYQITKHDIFGQRSFDTYFA